MVASFSEDECKVKFLPAPANWFFLLLAFGISVAVACKAHSFQWNSGALASVNDLEKNDRENISSSEVLILAQNQTVVGKDKNRKRKVGRKEAEKYFKDEAADAPKNPEPRAADHFLAIHIGGYINADSFRWGASNKVEDSGKMTAGVTYRMGEWTRSMDLLFRLDVNGYELPEGDPVKISILPLIQFPEASSRFPLYFGLGAGLGIFTTQIADESDISLDYQLIAGFRQFNLYQSTGVFVETGIKNHVHILSSGQFNGFFLSAGAVFTF